MQRAVAHAGTDFEQLGAEFRSVLSATAGQALAEEVDQVVGSPVQEQAEGVSQEAVAAQAIGAETVFEPSIPS
jgi:hypothetical protein